MKAVRMGAAIACAATLVLGRSVSARAQGASVEATASKSGPAVIPPTVRAHAHAEYPAAALHERLSATVRLEVLVDEQGHVADVRVTQPVGHGFDESALEAARRFVFEPARRGGVPVRAKILLSFDFQPPPVPEHGVSPAPSPGAWVAPPPAVQEVQVVGERRATLPHIAGSDSSTGQTELSLMPRYRAEGVLQAVPGLFTVQHSGGGKSQQYFLRGFDVDHGTDIAFFVDDAPINAVSHAHGQGYSDIHFLIPETIQSLDSTKGPYSARIGDFATAGSVTFRMADHLDESLARLELGPDGHERAVIAESPDLGDRWRAVVAAELFHEDGPFIHPEDFSRFNAYAKATRVLDARSELSLMLMAYGGSWNASGVLPARAVCGEGDGTPTPAAYSGSNCLSRWDSLDPSQGGGSQRVMASTTYRRQLDGHWELRATAFALHSNFQLFENDGIAAPFQPDGTLYGSQVEQDDTRTETGAAVRVTHRGELAGIPVRSSMGIQLRDDDIEAQLHRTQDRRRLDGIDADIPGPIVDDTINETELSAWFETDFRPRPWLRFVLGARQDRIDVAVNNEGQTAVDRTSGVRGAGQFSPKASMVVYPTRWLDLFANYGRGFHSNDARTIFEGSTTTLIATATGAEVGATVRPLPGLSVSAVGFILDLTSELVYDGDTASTAPSGATRRYGGEFTARYDFRDDLFADAAFTASHARYVDSRDVAAGTVFLPNAPVRTFVAGVGVREPVGDFRILGSLRVRSISDRPATQDGSLVETGSTVFDASAGLRWRSVEVVADLFNVADVAYREGQFAVQSRLPSEGLNTPQGIAFTPGLPRTLMVHGAVYW
jgi:TonB family protein